MRSDDLAPLLAAPVPPPIGFRQGAIVEWDPLTAENVVNVGGTDLVNLPTIASNAEVLLMKPGDVVGIQVVGNGATSTMYIIGRITLPGTPQAASFFELFGAEAALETSATAQGDTYPTFAVAPDGLGPSVTVRIGNTRRAIVSIGAFIQYHHGSGSGTGNYRVGRVSYRVTEVATGAVTSAANENRALILDTEGHEASLGAMSRDSLVSGSSIFPSPGDYTFEAMYATTATDAGGQMFYGHRTLIVLPL